MLLTSLSFSGCIGLGTIGDVPSGSEHGGSAGTDGKSPEGLQPVPGVAACAERSVPDQPLRRLSSEQYENTLRDLFGSELARPMLQGTLFPKTTIDSGFVNDAEANTINTVESNAIEDNAERIANAVLQDPAAYVTGLMPCGLNESYRAADIDGCVHDFIEQFGLRAYRRPLTDGETTIVRNLYDTLRAEQSATEAFAGLVQFFVQSPALLYRAERGAGEAAPGLVRLDDYEMASRLSYFLLNSMPDEELFEEAAAGRLSSFEQVEAQTRRLMATPRFERVLENFHRDWLQLYGLEEEKSAEFEGYTPAVRQSLEQETGQLVRYVLEEGDGNVATLFGTSSLPLNSTLAEFYGVPAPGAGPDEWVVAQVSDRAGLFTLASFMASQAEADRTSPIHRGAFFQREVLCNELPTLPGDIDTQGPLQDTSTLPTARERLAPLMESASCSGCHQLFNPTGLAFENYDAVGQWRDTEQGSPIDPSGTITVDGMQYDFDTPVQLANVVADSQQVRDCYALQWYRASLGRREFAQDECSIATVRSTLSETGGDLREMIVALTQTDGFLYRSPADAEEN